MTSTSSTKRSIKGLGLLVPLKLHLQLQLLLVTLLLGLSPALALARDTTTSSISATNPNPHKPNVNPPQSQSQPQPQPTQKNAIRPKLSSNSYAHKSALEMNIQISISSPEKGLGAFATRPIPIGTFLGTYGGETMTLEQVQARFWNKRQPTPLDQEWKLSRIERHQEITGNYIMELPPTNTNNATLVTSKFIDAEDGDVSSWCRFMNHVPETNREECNVKAFLQSEIGGEIHEYPRMYAIRDIQVGEELCWDYGEHFFIGDNKADYVE